MKLVFANKVTEVGDIASFVFEPHPDITWEAGQAIKIELPGPYGPLEHRFTVSSAPYEKAVMITTRLSGSPYKNALDALQPGDTVDAYQPDGNFAWVESDVSHILIAAGIGITAFHTVLKQRIHEGKPLTARLIYGASNNQHVFKKELQNWARNDPTFSVQFIDGRLKLSDIPETSGYMYLCGPSLMVDDLSAELLARGANEEKLIRDWFTGRLES